jgi:hypothetical protein
VLEVKLVILVRKVILDKGVLKARKVRLGKMEPLANKVCVAILVKRELKGNREQLEKRVLEV